MPQTQLDPCKGMVSVAAISEEYLEPNQTAQLPMEMCAISAGHERSKQYFRVASVKE